MANHIETLIQAAMLAPSGDNIQPWHFVLDSSGACFELHCDQRRDASPMNLNQRMSRIACGAALENIVRTAEHNGWLIEVCHGHFPTIASIRFLQEPEFLGDIEKVLRERHTNRRFYRRGSEDTSESPMPAAEAGAGSELALRWITDRAAIRSLAEIIGVADSLMFGLPAMRNAFLANIRFDLPGGAEAAEGLPLDSLGLGYFDKIGLKTLRYLPAWLIRGTRLTHTFRRRAETLVNSAAGLCVISASDESAQTDVEVGRLMQRAWLQLTARGLAVQPMMSYPVLDNWRRPSPNEVVKDGLSRTLSQLSRRLSQTIGPGAGRRIAAILRFGYPNSVAVRAGRRTLESCTERMSRENEVPGEALVHSS
jgi:hypothetical protein